MTIKQKKKLIQYLRNTPAETIADEIENNNLVNAANSFISNIHLARLNEEKASLQELIDSIDSKIVDIS